MNWKTLFCYDLICCNAATTPLLLVTSNCEFFTPSIIATGLVRLVGSPCGLSAILFSGMYQINLVY